MNYLNAPPKEKIGVSGNLAQENPIRGGKLVIEVLLFLVLVLPRQIGSNPFVFVVDFTTIQCYV